MMNMLIAVKNFVITSKRCQNCNLPLEGWRYRIFVKPICKIEKVGGKNICSRCIKGR